MFMFPWKPQQLVWSCTQTCGALQIWFCQGWYWFDWQSKNLITEIRNNHWWNVTEHNSKVLFLKHTANSVIVNLGRQSFLHSSSLKKQKRKKSQNTFIAHFRKWACTFSSVWIWTSSGAMRRTLVIVRAFILATGMVKTGSQESTQARQWTTTRTG